MFCGQDMPLLTDNHARAGLFDIPLLVRAGDENNVVFNIDLRGMNRRSAKAQKDACSGAN